MLESNEFNMEALGVLNAILVEIKRHSGAVKLKHTMVKHGLCVNS